MIPCQHKERLLFLRSWNVNCSQLHTWVLTFTQNIPLQDVCTIWFVQNLSLQKSNLFISNIWFQFWDFLYNRFQKLCNQKSVKGLLVAAADWISIQIMNLHEFNGAIIFMSWKIEHSIQRGKGELNRMFDLSMNDNNRTIEWMEKRSLFVLYNAEVDLCHLIGG